MSDIFDIPPEMMARLLESAPPGVDQTHVRSMLAMFRATAHQFRELMLHHEFGIDQMLTRINILRREFEQVHAYSPIEHVRSRLKSPESLIRKVLRAGIEPTVPNIRSQIRDIAGIRVTCGFESDVYWIAEMLGRQPDVTLLRTKDYIAHPKPNGYRSLHLIVTVPVYLSDRVEEVAVEVQIRTIAMDFWAATEHQLSYKYRGDLPEHLVAELSNAARAAADLDRRMGRLRAEIRSLGDAAYADA